MRPNGLSIRLPPANGFGGIGGVAARAIAGNGQCLATHDVVGGGLSLELGPAFARDERSAQ